MEEFILRLTADGVLRRRGRKAPQAGGPSGTCTGRRCSSSRCPTGRPRVDDRKGLRHQGLGAARVLPFEQSPHLADLVAQTRLARAVDHRPPFFLSYTLQRREMVCHLVRKSGEESQKSGYRNGLGAVKRGGGRHASSSAALSDPQRVRCGQTHARAPASSSAASATQRVRCGQTGCAGGMPHRAHPSATRTG